MISFQDLTEEQQFKIATGFSHELVARGQMTADPYQLMRVMELANINVEMDEAAGTFQIIKDDQASVLQVLIQEYVAEIFPEYRSKLEGEILKATDLDTWEEL